MVLLGQERSTIIRKREVYGIERVFDARIVLLGKESSTIKIKIDWEKKTLLYKWDYLMKGYFLGRRNLYSERTFHYEKFHKEKRAMKK